MNWLVMRSEEINSILKRMDEDIHLLFCIVKVKTCTSTSINTESPMQNLCTMMSRPNRYCVLKKGVNLSTQSTYSHDGCEQKES
jgi:hypothetical protein